LGGFAAAAIAVGDRSKKALSKCFKLPSDSLSLSLAPADGNW